MLKKQIIRAIGGLNSDDDPRYLSEGDYLEMLNMRVGSNQSEGERGLVETFKSNYKIQFPGVSEQDFTPLAVAHDIENNRIYILAHEGSGNYFQIYKFNLITDEIVKIYEEDAQIWNINASTKIYNPKILDGKLIWTDNVNPIKYVDLKRLENSYLNGIGLAPPILKWDSSKTYNEGAIIYWKDSYYKSLSSGNVNHQPDISPTYWNYLCKILDAYGDIVDPLNFNLAASPPLIAPTVSYLNATNREANNIRQQIFQFTYRYTYIDYRKSTFAPPSIIAPPDQEETIDGMFNSNQSYHNGLAITINTGSEEVRYIEIVGRSSSDPAAWFLVGEIMLFDKDGNRVIEPEIDYTYIWYNDNVKQLIDAELVYTLFTFIPVRAKHLELIEGNRLAVANITEGYDRIQQFVTIDLTYEDLGTVSSKERLDLYIAPLMQYDESLEYPYFKYYLGLRLPNDGRYGKYKLRIETDYHAIYEAEYNYTSGPYPITVKNGLITAINNAGWGYQIKGDGVPPSDYYLYFFGDIFNIEVELPFEGWDYRTGNYWEGEAADPVVNKYPSLKVGASHSWGIIYRDEAGRISPVLGAGELTKYIPFYTESSGEDIYKRPLIDFYIHHKPPDWAKSYEIVYAGNKTVSWFLHLLAYNICYGKAMDKHDEPNPALSYDTRLRRCSLEDMYVRTRGRLPSWTVEEYVWEKGDRIRIIGVVDSYGNVTKLNYMFDAEIIGVFKDKDWISPNNHTVIERDYLYFQNDGNVGLVNPDPNRNFSDVLIEIYRPYKEFSVTNFYTTGMTYQIGVDEYGNKYHKGTDDQVLDSAGQVLSPARVRNTSHDVWKYYRNFTDKVDNILHHLWAESNYASDFYSAQKLTSSGLPIPDLYTYKRTVLTKRIRHGGVYNFGTELNNIAKFDYDDFKDVKDEYGPIEGIREVGFILKVIQHRKISSIYLSRREAFSPDGSSQFLFTNKVFGELRPGLEKYGTRHPESIIVHNNYLYFWDEYEGAIIRDAENGQIPLNLYKMKRFFIDKAIELSGVGFDESAVKFSYNVVDDSLYCTFFNGTDYETLVFSEIENRWKFSTDAKIKKPFWLGRRMFHIWGNSIYEWWREGENGYLNLSGEQKSARLKIVAAEDPMKLKHFNAVAVYQKGAVPDVSILIPEKVSAVGRDMESIATNWTQREGVYYGQILRDVNTPGINGTNNKYLNGIRLRGQYAVLTLNVNEDQVPVRVYNIMVTSTFSERSM